MTCRKAEKEYGHTDNSANGKEGAEATQERERAILPLPVKQVDGVDVKTWTVKQWFQKINEELDELKAEVLNAFYSLEVVPPDRPDLRNAEHDRMPKIAEEAADTITAITSMLEAMGIDERQRQAAQRRVNERNRERGRTVSTFEIVQDILVQQLAVKCDDVTPESLLDDLMADSLYAVEIALALEEEFNIVLTAESVGSWVTVQDIVDSVDKEIGTFWGEPA